MWVMLCYMKDDSTILFVAGYVVCQKGRFTGGNVFRIEFDFRTEMRDGMIFFAYGGSNAYFFVQLVNGSMHVEFYYDTVLCKVFYNYVTTCDGKWHHATILKRNQRIGMTLDRQPNVYGGDQTLKVTGLDIESALYIGGIKPGSKAEHFVKKFDIPLQGSMLHL